MTAAFPPPSLAAQIEPGNPYPPDMSLAEKLRVFGAALRIAPGIWKHPVYAQLLFDAASELEKSRAAIATLERLQKEGDRG